VRRPALTAAAAALSLWAAAGAAVPPPPAPGWLFNDSHFHLTNYVQRGLTMRQYVAMMGTTVKRSTVFGIPLQQTWSYPNSGDYAPTYYLQTDASLYYYSFTDAMIATSYLSLPPADRARLDPMITGFNPADMYAADHIKRVLQIFPGVFSGIGEFSIHKEFVSGKVAGETASLTDPALDRILDFAAEAGLVAIVHCDIDMPFTKRSDLPIYYAQMRDLLLRHPKTTIIWAHTGLGRVVQPGPLQATQSSEQRPPTHLELIERILSDPRLGHVYFDISWDELAKYAVATPETVGAVAAVFDRHPDRFLFGTDNVAPPDLASDLKVYEMWAPIFDRLRPATKAAITMGNYERLFDAARLRVRAWERANAT
jgi:hypothetical protein